jgi:hypothetical protein
VIHTFDKSFEANHLYESELDKYFGVAYHITKATREEERKGIDRYFEHVNTGVCYSVEYKTDHKAAETGNVFIETKSVDTANKAGWAYTSLAQVLIYFVPAFERAYRTDMTAIKRILSTWSSYPEGRAWNAGRNGEVYRTWGRLVPLDVFRGVCLQEHDVAAPLDEPTKSLVMCIHDVPQTVCKVCNGEVKRMIARSA